MATNYKQTRQVENQKVENQWIGYSLYGRHPLKFHAIGDSCSDILFSIDSSTKGLK